MNPVIRSLGHLRSKKAVKPLTSLLSDNLFTLRREAAIALGRIKDNRAVNPLIILLKDENKYVRWAAIYALCQLRTETAFNALLVFSPTPETYCIASSKFGK